MDETSDSVDEAMSDEPVSEDVASEEPVSEDVASEEPASEELEEESESQLERSDPAAAARSAARYRVAVFALLLLAGGLTIAAAVRFWLPPWLPVVLFLCLGVGPLFFWATIGAFVFDPSKTSDGVISGDSPPLGQRLKMALVPVVGAACAGALIAGIWYIPAARGALASFSASQRLTGPLEGALTDASPDVRLAACEGLAKVGADSSAQILMNLGDRDDRVVDCALNAMPTQAVPPPQLAAMSVHWHNELMSSDDTLTGDRACVLANRVRVAERKGLKQASMHLMSCALDADSSPARECCAQSFRALLGGGDVEPAMVMATPNELIRSGFSAAVPTLLKVTHSQDPRYDAARANMRLDTPSSRAWAMGVACEALQLGGASAREQVSGWMAEAVSTDSCSIPPASETTVRIWTAICSELYTPARLTSAVGNESDIFCQAVNGALIADASNAARHVVQTSMRGAKSPGRRAEVMRALLNYSGRMARAVMDDDVSTTPTDPQILFGKGGMPTDGTLGNGMMSQMFEMMQGAGIGQGGNARQDDFGGTPLPVQILQQAEQNANDALDD